MFAFKKLYQILVQRQKQNQKYNISIVYKLEQQLKQLIQIILNTFINSDYFKEDEIELCQQQGYTPVILKKQIILKNIYEIQFGNDRIRPWYFSPYYFQNTKFIQLLHICPHCLKYTLQQELMQKHMNVCKFKNNYPGVKIYDDKQIQVYEIDGRCEKLFCQNICLFSRMFLQGKTCFYSTNNFIFYLFVSSRYNKDQNDKTNNIIGYFSKAKTSQNTLSCILTFPQYMQKGISNIMIDFSFMLARYENRVSGPEEPLSDLGSKAFEKYYRWKLDDLVLNTQSKYLKPKDLSFETGIKAQCINKAAEQLSLRIEDGQINIQKSQKQAQKYKDEIQKKQQNNLLLQYQLQSQYLDWVPYPGMFGFTDQKTIEYQLEKQ